MGDFSDERIVICFPHETVEAAGKGLTIRKYCDGDLQIAGKIYSLCVLGADGRGD